MSLTIVPQHDASYDDIVTFGHAMYRIWQYSSEPGSLLLDYFEAPYKWEAEYQKWRKLGGTLDKECLDAFEHWYDHKDDPTDDEEQQ